jgi:hypothetical protein
LFDREKEIYKTICELKHSAKSKNKNASHSEKVMSVELNKKSTVVNVVESVVKTASEAKKVNVIKMALETNEVQQANTSNKPTKTSEVNSGTKTT